MSQDLKDPTFLKKCAVLWKHYAGNTSIDSCNGTVTIHEKSTFLAFIDMTLGIVIPGVHVCKWKIRGIAVKLLGGKPYLDFPADKGANDKYYPKFFPVSPEDRMVITRMVFSDSRIVAAIAEAARQVEAAQAAADAPSGAIDVPFDAESEAGLIEFEGAPGSIGNETDNPFEVEA